MLMRDDPGAGPGRGGFYVGSANGPTQDRGFLVGSKGDAGGRQRGPEMLCFAPITISPVTGIDKSIASAIEKRRSNGSILFPKSGGSPSDLRPLPASGLRPDESKLPRPQPSLAPSVAKGVIGGRVADQVIQDLEQFAKPNEKEKADLIKEAFASGAINSEQADGLLMNVSDSRVAENTIRQMVQTLTAANQGRITEKQAIVINHEFAKEYWWSHSSSSNSEEIEKRIATQEANNSVMRAKGKKSNRQEWITPYPEVDGNGAGQKPPAPPVATGMPAPDDFLPPNVIKALNTGNGHACGQAVKKGLVTEGGEKVAREEISSITKSIEKSGFPKGTIPDPGKNIDRSDSVLVPYRGGAIVYEITKDGIAKVRTVLSKLEYETAKLKLGKLP
jgi:hypothetical protein